MSAFDVAGSANPTIAEILAKLGADPNTGLNPNQLQERLSKYGPNALPEEKKSALSALLAYFWGPIPWMIEAAALMALIVGDWGDLTIIASIIPSNHKWFRDLAISQIIVRQMQDMDMQLPKPTVNLAEIRREYHEAKDGEKAGRRKKR